MMGVEKTITRFNAKIAPPSVAFRGAGATSSGSTRNATEGVPYSGLPRVIVKKNNRGDQKGAAVSSMRAVCLPDQ